MIGKYLKPMQAADEYGIGGGGTKDIDIDFSSAQTVAGQMIDEVELIKVELDKIVSSTDSLSGIWQSTKATQAREVCNNFTDTFNGFYNLIKNTPLKIEAAAKGLQNAENSEGGSAGNQTFRRGTDEIN